MKYGVKEIKNFNECIKNLFTLSVLVRGILVCKKGTRSDICKTSKGLITDTRIIIGGSKIAIQIGNIKIAATTLKTNDINVTIENEDKKSMRDINGFILDIYTNLTNEYGFYVLPEFEPHNTTKVVYAKTGEIILATYTKLCNNYTDRAKFIYNSLTKNKLTHLDLSKNTVSIEENNILSIDGVSYFNCEKDLAFTVVDTDRKLKLFELTDLFPDARSMSGMVKEVRATLA